MEPDAPRPPVSLPPAGVNRETAAAISPRPIALSPSRAGDFRQCPLLYRLRAIDRLPEPKTLAQVRGTAVHSALENLFALPRPERNAEAALALLAEAWSALLAEDEELTSDFGSAAATAELLRTAEPLIRRYFTLEDPRRFDPRAREMRVETEVPGAEGVPLRGFVDRVDVSDTGLVRIVDYKTGRAPSAMFENKAVEQMRFYALMMWLSEGVVPAQLKILYLGDGRTLTHAPSLQELEGFARTVSALWRAIRTAGLTGAFAPRRSKLCGWCAHQRHCPEFDGTPPEYPGWPETPESPEGSDGMGMAAAAL